MCLYLNAFMILLEGRGEKGILRLGKKDGRNPWLGGGAKIRREKGKKGILQTIFRQALRANRKEWPDEETKKVFSFQTFSSPFPIFLLSHSIDSTTTQCQSFGTALLYIALCIIAHHKASHPSLNCTCTNSFRKKREAMIESKNL